MAPNQLSHQRPTEDRNDDMFEEKLLLLRQVREISPGDLNNFEWITFKIPLLNISFAGGMQV